MVGVHTTRPAPDSTCLTHCPSFDLFFLFPSAGISDPAYLSHKCIPWNDNGDDSNAGCFSVTVSRASTSIDTTRQKYLVGY